MLPLNAPRVAVLAQLDALVGSFRDARELRFKVVLRAFHIGQVFRLVSSQNGNCK